MRRVCLKGGLRGFHFLIISECYIEDRHESGRLQDCRTIFFIALLSLLLPLLLPLSAPPLALLPLVAREMHAWLDGAPDRVAVIHCKGTSSFTSSFLFHMHHLIDRSLQHI